MKGKVGLGFRRDFAIELLEDDSFNPAFIEFAPENWMKIGGFWKEVLNRATEKFNVVCHGLSLSVGSPDELDWEFIKDLRDFLDQNKVLLYSEHLSYSQTNNAHLYDLLPIPFTQDAVNHIVDRIKKVQDFLGRALIIENVSYYTPVAAQMREIEFINKIIDGSGCNLLLDVNNVYVNAFNHNYNSEDFIRNLPLDSVAYIHMAGHEKVSDDLIIDTHGQPIIDPVYDLFNWTLDYVKPVPVLLERDFNIPELTELNKEVDQLQAICDNKWKTANVAKS
ncbi:MAG: DUF692 domain-containing protein [Schleiferiaceae bacterium]|nr:DUF692 domain-containing protein [Schleiferiaceae bacterium]